MTIIMIPNTVFALKNKDGFANNYKNKAVEICEQIGRFGCFALMIFNIPYTLFNFWFENALLIYLIVNGVLCIAYLTFWAICRNKNSKLKALSLSTIPSTIFLFSAVMLGYIPLMIFAIKFGISHILLSYKNIALQ